MGYVQGMSFLVAMLLLQVPLTLALLLVPHACTSFAISLHAVNGANELVTIVCFAPQMDEFEAFIALANLMRKR